MRVMEIGIALDTESANRLVSFYHSGLGSGAYTFPTGANGLFAGAGSIDTWPYHVWGGLS